MKNIEEIKSEIEQQHEIVSNYVVKRDNYLKDGNEFAFNIMCEGIAKSLAKIEALEWVLGE